jgi:hypothetical protein
MIASMSSEPLFHTSRNHPCIAASGGTGSAACLTQSAKSAKKNFKSYPIGYFHLDIAEVRSEEGKLYLFVAHRA